MSKYKSRLESFREDNIVTNEDGFEISSLDDDYYYYKSQLKDRTNPLSDDYCKYDY